MVDNVDYEQILKDYKQTLSKLEQQTIQEIDMVLEANDMVKMEELVRRLKMT